MDNKVNFLWIGDKLTDIGLMSMQSFHKQGYDCVLWSYEEIINIPQFAKVGDANKVLDINNDIYKGYHSDYFRFTLIYNEGGIYSDLDNILLKELPDVEYIIGGYTIDCNSNLIKAPKESDFIGDILDDMEARGISKINQYNGLDLYDFTIKNNLENFIIDGSKINYFTWKGNLLKPLLSDIIDWESVDSYNVHLFENAHRVAFKNNKNYIENMKNLKTIIL